MPETVLYLGSGTMLSPWPPSTVAVMSSTDTPSSMDMNVRKRALSSTPAIPMMRSRGNWHCMCALVTITSSGFETMIRIQSGDCFTTSSVTEPTMPALMLMRSSRLMPGLRATPAVTTTMSESFVSA